MADSYINNLQGKKYYHWLERAQIGQIECAVIRWPKGTSEKIYQNIKEQAVHFESHAEFLPTVKSYAFTENKNQSQLFELSEGTKYVSNQSFIRELSRVVNFYLNNETQVSFVEATQIDFNPPLPREIHPLHLEKKFELRLAKEDSRLVKLNQILGGTTALNSNEMLFTYVIHELLQNLIIIKDKFPQFKIYFAIPAQCLNSDKEVFLEICDFDFSDSVTKKYFLKADSAKDENPQLGNFLITDVLSRTNKENQQSLQLGESYYL